MLAPVLLAALAALAAAPPLSTPEQMLDEGVALYRNLEFGRAQAKLSELVTLSPPKPLRARAHLYLGLIAFENLRAAAADEEFQLAMADDSAIELPLGTSPKARIAFAKSRAVLARKLEATSAPLDATLTDPFAEAPAPRPRRSHALSWTLGALGLAAAAVAAVGAGELVGYGSFVGSANASPGGVTAAQAGSARSAARAWQIVSPVCAGLAVAGFVTAGLAW